MDHLNSPASSHPATSIAPTNEPVSLSGAVMTHPKRVEAARLLAEADAQGRLGVVVDPDPDGPPTALRTANLAWDCVGKDATHHLVLQDDVVLAEGFFDYVERVASAVPHEAVAFYAGWEGRNGAVVRLAALTGVQWAYALQEHVPCLGLMLPSWVARGYARFMSEQGAGWPYDVVMQRYLNACGVPVRLAVPSTVQHTDVPSLVGNADHGWRLATLFTGRAVEPTTYDCSRFPVIPFYQYGDARCAVWYGDQCEYIETERYLHRAGLLERSDTALAATDPVSLPERVRRAVWLTGFAIGAVMADITSEVPEPSMAAAVMESLGPGGLCEDFTAGELTGLVDPVRELALAALEEGRRARQGGVRSIADLTPGASVAVTGDDHRFGAQSARLLGDLGYRANYLPNPLDVRQLDGISYVVHLGRPAAGPGLLADVLSAAEKARVERLVYAGSMEVYSGSDERDTLDSGGGEQALTEEALTEPPCDSVALGWWREEERCRQWGKQHGIEVQVLRLAELVGPNVRTDGVAARWIHLAWTRQPLRLRPQAQHQLLDYRDMAGSIGAVLAAPPRHPVFNVASATYAEEELAELVANVSRPTPWERSYEPGLMRRCVMATRLITTGLQWQGSASLLEGMRALAQWLACDTHGPDSHSLDTDETGRGGGPGDRSGSGGGRPFRPPC